MNTRKLRALPYLILLLPLDIFVAICLFIASAIASLTRGLKPQGYSVASDDTAPSHDNSPSHDNVASYDKGRSPGALAPGSRPLATVQILNWNGKDLLRGCLQSVLGAIEEAGGEHRVLVVDNGSTDGSVALVRSEFPQVELLALDRNYGFVEGNNRAVERVRTGIVVFLNNDMIVDRGFLAPLLDGFTDPCVFAVTSQIFFSDPQRRREETGKTRATFNRGFLEVWHDEIDAADEERGMIPVFWAGGGSCAFDRQKYLQLGGLDGVYAPLYVEDTDISYRAWKRGWKCLLAPGSRVVHKHRATSSRRFTHRFVDNTIRRNLYLFIWKNIRDLRMLAEHILNLPRIHARSIMATDGPFEVQAFVRAVLRLPIAVSRRIFYDPEALLTDADVIARSRQ